MDERRYGIEGGRKTGAEFFRAAEDATVMSPTRQLEAAAPIFLPWLRRHFSCCEDSILMPLRSCASFTGISLAVHRMAGDVHRNLNSEHGGAESFEFEFRLTMLREVSFADDVFAALSL